MPVITLLTDRKINDFFLGRVKGEILRRIPKAQLIDIAHDIGAFNVSYASFIVKHSFANFPDGTIHLLGVDAEKGRRQRHLLLKAAGQYFLAADNGIFNLSFKQHEIEAVYDVTDFCKSDDRTPALLDFVQIAASLVKKNELDQFGPKITNYKRSISFQPSYENDFILGKAIYIDSYRNLVTNIDRDLFDFVGEGRPIKIYVGSTGNRITKMSNHYQDMDDGELLALFNSMNLLEIAIVKGKVADLLNLSLDTNIRIEFDYDDYPNSENDVQGRLL